MAAVTFGKNIYRLDSVTSTQEVLKEQFLQGAAEGSIAVAQEQTLGKGRQGRSWYSPAGKGLWLSTLIVPSGPEDRWTWVPLWAGVVIQGVLRELLNESQNQGEVQLRWPNDLMLADGKLGGILAEKVRNPDKRQAVVLGLGLNLLQRKEDFPPHLRNVAVSLLEGTGLSYLPDEVLEKFILSADGMYSLLKPIDPPRLRDLWLSAAWGFNRRLRVISGKQVYEGVFFDLGSCGELCLRGDNGDRICLASVEGMQKVTIP